jgi:Cof subfamily protein (haloacid dehalogenase superfamily)
MIKALFFDLDGTLLTSSRKLSDRTKTALKACREEGIKVFMATARPPLLSKMLDLSADEEEIIQDGGVFYNGGCICCKNEKIYTFLPEEAVIRSIEAIKPYKEVNLAIQMADERHSFRYSLTDKEYKLWGVNNSELIFFENLKYNHVIKIVVFSPWNLLSDLCDELIDTVGAMANVYLTGKNDFRSIEIVDKKINKKLAIDRIIDLCGFDYGEVAVFGDDYNDMEMLKGFKHSIAMGNACEEAKSCASYITYGNDEEGIHYALSDILKLI